MSLAKFIEERNNHVKFFGGKAYNINNLSAADKAELMDSIDNNLSPENLSCDGEASRGHVMKRGAMLRKAEAELKAMK